MSLEFLVAIRRRWWAVALLALIGLVCGVVHAHVARPVYQASTTVFVATDASSISDLTSGSSYTQQVVKTYADLVTTSSVLDPAIARLGLDTSSPQLARSVQAEVPLNSSLVVISVEGTDPERTARTTNAIAASLIHVVTALSPRKTTTTKTLGATKATVSTPVNLTQVQKVLVPTAPVSPNLPLDMALGLLIGAALGCAAAVLRQVADTRIRGEADVEAITDRPVLGGLALDKRSARRPLIVHADPLNPRAESYRTLRTNLQFVDTRGGHGIVVTSSIPSEGKTTSVANLAIALAEAGDRVCVIDADLRKPRVADTFGLDGGVGLTDVLIGKASLRAAVQWWGDKPIGVIPAGRIPPNPSELLGSRAMEHVLKHLAERFDVVLIDSPPLLPVTDAAVLAAPAAGVLVMTASGQTKRGQLKAALARLERAKANVFGVVLTKVPSRGQDAYTYRKYRQEAPVSEAEDTSSAFDQVLGLNQPARV